MKAPRRPLRRWHRLARGALMGLCLWMLPAASTVAQGWQSELLEQADYADPTGRYPHAVLGDAIEYGALVLRYSGGLDYTIRLPQERVFEDIAPRMIDVNGDGKREALVVESHSEQGARLAIYNGQGLMAATPYIGTRFRWLAPIGAVDLDGDGHVEIAYIDRPHLAKRLRIWRFENNTLVHVADKSGLTNHRIGEDFITGGVRACAGKTELIVVDANWTNIMAVTYSGSQVEARTVVPFTGQGSVQTALTCS